MFLQIAVAWLYGHILEYALHRFVLHNRKVLKGKPFKRHFSRHHGAVRKNGMLDFDYYNLKKYSPLDLEPLSLLFLSIAHLPLAFYFPYAYLVLLMSGVAYFAAHALSHLFPATMVRFMPWHRWHHLGKNQNMNYGVRLPIIDVIAGTYKPPAERGEPA